MMGRGYRVDPMAGHHHSIDPVEYPYPNPAAAAVESVGVSQVEERVLQLGYY